MVFKRIWGFMARHKKKFIFTGVLVGGGYAAYKWYLPKLQNQMLQKLLKMAGDDDTLKELLSLAGGGGGDKKKAKFTHNQEVSDKWVKAYIVDGATADTRSLLSDKHNANFKINEISREAQQADSQEKKMLALQNLTNEIFARGLSAVFVLCAMVMVHRVELNILGRQMDEAEDAGTNPAFTAFIETGRYVGDGGLLRIADASRKGIQKMAAAKELTPKTKVASGELEKHLAVACAEVYAEVFAGPACVQTLLPDSIDSTLPKESQGEVKPFLDEARDALESPHFLEALQAVVAAVVGQVVGDLSSNGKGGAGPLAGDGTAVPLGKLLGRMTELSSAVLGAEAGGENAYVPTAVGAPTLSEFCESLYFQEGTK